MLSTTLVMSLKKPSFQSNLPEYLLKDASDKDRYILEHLNVISQTSNWLIDETVKQSEKLESIENQTFKTNGRVNKLEEMNPLDKDTNKELKQIVSIKVFAQKYLFNRYVLGALFLFVFGAIKVLANEESRGFFFRIIGF